MFITFEGVDGSGKTSHIPPIVEFLREKKYKVFPSREPGGTLIGERIRDIIFNPKNVEMHPRAETFLFLAARAEVVEEVIRPKLRAGFIVISDRYVDSTLAYQGYGYRQNLEDIRKLIDYATSGLIPDLTILLDVSVEISLKRKEMNKERNRIDARSIQFHQRVRAGYLKLAKEDGRRWVVVDASQTWEMVQEDLRRIILERLQ